VRTALALFFAAAAVASGQGTTPKTVATDYPASGAGLHTTVGADYTVRSVMAGSRSIFLKDYLAVEVALYSERPIVAAASSFSLRVNGSRGVLFSQSVGMVAASLKYPDWESTGQKEATIGLGPADVVLGRQSRTPRFPDDPTTSRLPKSPAESDKTVEDPAADAVKVIQEVALAEGRAHPPLSGYIFFPYKAKPEKIKSLELLFQESPDSKPVAIRLR
jgi:hypothetical protein